MKVYQLNHPSSWYNHVFKVESHLETDKLPNIRIQIFVSNFYEFYQNISSGQQEYLKEKYSIL